LRIIGYISAREEVDEDAEVTQICPVIAEFLVKFLEQEVCRLNWDVGFVTSTMQEIGVQMPRLLEVYDQLFKTRVLPSLFGVISCNSFLTFQ